MAKRRKALTELQRAAIKVWMNALATGAEVNHYKRLQNLEKGREWTPERKAAAAQRMREYWQQKREAKSKRLRSKFEKVEKAIVAVASAP